MIEWLQRVDAGRPFLFAGDRTWTYGDAVTEVGARVIAMPRIVRPSLDPDSVFDLVAAVSGGGATVLSPGIDMADPAAVPLVVFTSGTTGPPKGVRLTMANMAAASRASVSHLGHGAGDNWLLAMPLHHVGGISIVVRQVFAGGSITLLPDFDPETFSTAMKGAATMVSVVPTMLARILGFGPFTSLRAVLVGGGPIPDGLLEEAAAAGLPVLPSYGMTETLGQVATLRPGSPLAHRAHPLPGIDLRIESDGRIAVRGVQVSPGYLDEPDRIDPWFVTNDLGEIDREGAVHVLGRADTVVVSGGENVPPERVEAAVRGHPDVIEAVVVGLSDREWGEMVVCVYEGAAEPEALQRWTSELLPGFMVPKRWVRVASVPRTTLGKLDREAARGLART